MSLSIEVLRADDLVHLHVEGENLRLDRHEGEPPALVLDDAAQAGFLIVRFPAQTIVEEAAYESSPSPALSDEAAKPYNHPPPTPAPLPTETRYRVGHPSRLVFRIAPGSDLRIPYTIRGLLDWSALRLNVSALAGLSPAPTLPERLAAPPIAAPRFDETAIELPYQLVLSPNGEAAWRHALEPQARNGVFALWNTRLALSDAATGITEISRAHPAPLRAIWSPDYKPLRLTNADEPRFGEPDKDWPSPPVLTPMTPSDRHEIVALTSGFSGYVRDLDDFRWYEPRPILASRLMLSALGGWLTSRGEWDPPAAYRSPQLRIGIAVDTWSRELAALNRAAPKLFPVARFVHAPAGQQLADDARPHAEQASSAAAALRQEDDFVDALQRAVPLLTAAGIGAFGERIDPRQWADRRGSVGALLNLSEWSHIATLARDHYVRIVYEGFLFPFGHRAALIKVTERKIVDHKQRGTIAHLFQRMYIVVREPLRNFRDPEVFAQLEDGGRALPFRSIRLTTLITPDIADPNQPQLQVAPGRKAFWVRLGSGATSADDFKFHAVGEDIAGHHVDFAASLVFVPYSEITGTTAQQHVTYATSGIPGIAAAYDKSGPERRCAVPGQKLTLAEGNGKDNTTLVTHELYFTVQPAPVNKRFGGFLPKLFKANVQVPAVDLMVGDNSRLDVALHDAFLKNHADNVNGLFAQVVREPTSGTLADEISPAQFQAKDAGGLATPDLAISSLTRELGPMAGSPQKAARNEFDAADFFGAMASAKLFGTFPLTALIRSASASEGAPKLQIHPEAGPPKALVGTLKWEPQVGDVSLPPGTPIVAFKAKKAAQNAALTVNVRVVKVVDGPAPPVTTIDGALTSFSIELVGVIEVRFEGFTFRSEPGKKLDVGVSLDATDPVVFLEDLKFVQTLKDTLPPDLFGDGPSLDIDARRIKAGFSVGLPPVALGVLALRDLSFGAFLELPFADGKPLLDLAFCRREKPCNLTVAFLGGGGFFHLQTDTDGIKLLEAALEFGASASVNLGVASGGVHIMAGIYFSLQRKGSSTALTATLGGYLRMGGELSVLGLISVSLEFYLGFTYDGKAAHGIATLTVKVEVLCFSTSVAITVEKSFGGSAGDPVFEETFTTPAVWLEYGSAFA